MLETRNKPYTNTLAVSLERETENRKYNQNKYNTMDELQDEIRILIQEIQSLHGEIDKLKGDVAENNTLLKRIWSAVNRN